MPMDFPDMKSLERIAAMYKFRKRYPQETEERYREAVADFVAPKDIIESQEIRNKVGWDQWTEEQNKDMLRRGGMNI